MSGEDWQTIMILGQLFGPSFFYPRKPRTEPNEDEYMGNDRLLHCKKCKAPVQYRLFTEYGLHTLPCKCKCEKGGGL